MGRCCEQALASADGFRRKKPLSNAFEIDARSSRRDAHGAKSTTSLSPALAAMAVDRSGF